MKVSGAASDFDFHPAVRHPRVDRPAAILRVGPFEVGRFYVEERSEWPVCDAGSAYRLRPSLHHRRAWLSPQVRNSTPSGWILRLVPDERGWVLQVTVEGWENENLARLTPPWHGPNARYLEGWHFRNADNTDPNDGSINQPQEFREFIFSPAVGIDSNTTVAPRRWTLSPGSERSAAGGCSSNRTSSHRRGQANGPRLNH
jgi:hypothetical protein